MSEQIRSADQTIQDLRAEIVRLNGLVQLYSDAAKYTDGISSATELKSEKATDNTDNAASINEFDIVIQLRKWLPVVPVSPAVTAMDAAANEIERLRDVMYRVVDEDCTVAVQNGCFYADGEPLFSVPCSKTSERTPASHATPSEGTEQHECTEPVAWLVEGCEYGTGCEYQYASLLKESVEAAVRDNGGRLVPLYRSPTLTDAEREAIELAYSRMTADTHYAAVATTLRGLLERTK